MASKAEQYEAARLHASRLYPTGLRLKNVWNMGQDYDASVSVRDEQRCEIHIYGHPSRDLTLSATAALVLARWIIETFEDARPEGR